MINQTKTVIKSLIGVFFFKRETALKHYLHMTIEDDLIPCDMPNVGSYDKPEPAKVTNQFKPKKNAAKRN